eukprot:SAG22_NODE_24_length_30194_cov_6.086327_3_plen_2209_part_00
MQPGLDHAGCQTGAGGTSMADAPAGPAEAAGPQKPAKKLPEMKKEKLSQVLADLQSQDDDGNDAIAALRDIREYFEASCNAPSSGPVLKVLARFQTPTLQRGALFAVWDGAEKPTSRAVVHVLHAFRAQLRACLAAATRSAGPDRKLFLAGYSIASELISSRAHSFFELISSRADRAAEAGLQVLTEVVRFGGSLARSVLTQIDWNGKALSTLMTSRLRQRAGADSRDSRKPKAQAKIKTEPVRAAYIRFALAMLESGSAEQDIVDGVLLAKHFIPSMWSDIKQDSPTLVNEVLKSLRATVLEGGRNITPGVKRRVFNSHAIAQIASLYTTLSRDVAHRFLLELFNSPSHGFRCSVVDDAQQNLCSGGLAGGENNSGTMNLLTSLQADRYDRPRALLMCMLEACPQLQGPFITAFPFSLDPQLSLRWVEHAALLCNVLRLQWLPAASELAQSPSARVAALARWTLPRSLTQSVLSKSLQHKNRLIVYHTLLMIASALERLKRVSAAFGGTTVDGMQNLLPSIQVYVALLQKESGASHDQSILFGALIRVVHMYEFVWPGTLLEAEIDVGKFASAAGGFAKMPLDARRAMLALLSHADRNIEWWKRKQTRGSLSKFGELLVVLSEPSLSAQAFELAKRLLLSTGLFDGCELEATCWLQPLCAPRRKLDNVGSSGGSSTEAAKAATLDVAEFLDAIVQQAKQKHIVLSDDVARLLRLSNGGVMPDNFAGQFSVVTLAALQRLNSGNQPSAAKWAEKPRGLRDYACAVMMSILQCKLTATPLALLLLEQAEEEDDEAKPEDRGILISFARSLHSRRAANTRTLSASDTVLGGAWVEKQVGSTTVASSRLEFPEVKQWNQASCFGFGAKVLQSIVQLQQESTVPRANIYRWLMRVALRQDTRWDELVYRQLVSCACMLLHDAKMPTTDRSFFVSAILHPSERVLLRSRGLEIADVEANLVDLSLLVYDQEDPTGTQVAAQTALFHAATLTQALNAIHNTDRSYFFSQLLDCPVLADNAGRADIAMLILLVGVFADDFDPTTFERAMEVLTSPTFVEDGLDATCSWVLCQMLRCSIKSPQQHLTPNRLMVIIELAGSQIDEPEHRTFVELASQTLTTCISGDGRSSEQHGYGSALASSRALEICWQFAAQKIDGAAGLHALVQCCPGQRQAFAKKLAQHFEDASTDQQSLTDLISGRSSVDVFLTDLPQRPSIKDLILPSKAVVAAADEREIFLWPELWRLHLAVIAASTAYSFGDSPLALTDASDMIGRLLDISMLDEDGGLKTAVVKCLLSLLGTESPPRMDLLLLTSATLESLTGALEVQLATAAATSCISCMHTSLSRIPRHETPPSELELEEYASGLLDSCLNFHGTSSEVIGQSAELVRLILKCRYTSALAIRMVRNLTEAAIKTESAFLTACEIGQLVVQHPSFAAVMTGTDGISAAVRTDLIGLLLAVCTEATTSPNFCPDLDAAKILFAAYSATTSDDDRLLLEIFRACEREGSTAPIPAWGRCVKYFTVAVAEETEETSLLAMLDSQECVTVVKETIADATENIPSLDGHIVVDEGDHTAGPDSSFLLPFCAAVLRSPVDSRRCIELGCLGYVVSGMSSSDLAARITSYQALARFLDKVTDESGFAERYQIMLLLHALRMGVVTEFQLVPAVVTAYVRSALRVLLRPDHALYTQVNAFLLQRPFLDLTDVPMFYSLFNSSEPEFKTERAWILHILVQGVESTGLDLSLYRRRHVFELLMSFFHAEHADGYTCKLVLALVQKCCRLPEFFSVLLQRHGIVPWLAAAVTADQLQAAADETAADLLAAAVAALSAALDTFLGSPLRRRRQSNSSSTAFTWAQFASAGRTLIEILLSDKLTGAFFGAEQQHGLVLAVLGFVTKLQGQKHSGLVVAANELVELQNKLVPVEVLPADATEQPVTVAGRLFELVTTSTPARHEAKWTISGAVGEDGVGNAPPPLQLTASLSVVEWLLQHIAGCGATGSHEQRAAALFAWLQHCTVAGSPVTFSLWVLPKGVSAVKGLVSLASELAINAADRKAMEAAAGFLLLLLDALLRLSRTSSVCQSCPAVAVASGAAGLLPALEAVLPLAMERLPNPTATAPRQAVDGDPAAGVPVAARRLLLVVLCSLTDAVTAAGAALPSDLRGQLEPLAGLPTAAWADSWQPVLAAALASAGEADAAATTAKKRKGPKAAAATPKRKRKKKEK